MKQVQIINVLVRTVKNKEIETLAGLVFIMMMMKSNNMKLLEKIELGIIILQILTGITAVLLGIIALSTPKTNSKNVKCPTNSEKVYLFCNKE